MDQGQLARVRRSLRVAVDGDFEICRQRVGRRRIGARRAGRRHRARAQLADDFFPGFGVRGNVCEVRAGEGQPAGFEAIVVTGDAVLVDRRLCIDGALRRVRL